jgi:mono/diheme cytochrome c family protein
MRGRVKIVIAAALVAAGVYVAFKDDITQIWDAFHVKVAEYPQPKKTVWLEQNVSQEQLNWFYHADQGTRTLGIPYEWFMKLEQPTIPWLIFTAVAPFKDPAYLDRFGFIPVPEQKDVLPIGFAHGGAMLDPSGAPWRNPVDKKDMTGIGLTCAACHTGRFTYKDTAVIIDGGPALTNLLKLKQGVGVALLMTRYLPGRFERFAENILGKDATPGDRTTLKYQIDQVLGQLKEVQQLENSVATQSIEEGYGRLDALNRIGNQVFALDLKKPENYRGSSAPVHYPRIWNTPWFDWVQYNGSIMRPMVRNAGESLGVSSELNLTEPAKGLFKSSVDVDALHKMEQMIAGDPPSVEQGFSGLKSPEWPENILPRIDRPLAARGGELYKENCQGCHRPPVSDKAAFFDFTKKWWGTNEDKKPILIVENIPIEHIGTDPSQAADMKSRRVALPANLGIDETKFAKALGAVVERTVDRIYDEREPRTSDEDRRRLNGYMPNKLQDDIAYKVRPLNGVWATPPYLHNGSVPTVYDLLSPFDDRPKQFYLGNREYDPVKMGYKTDELTNGFLFDTTIRGNANTGHEFNDKPEGTRGRIGRKLEPDERKAIIEYLKTL